MILSGSARSRIFKLGVSILTGHCLTFQKSKLKYYNLMIQVDQHEGSYLSICKHYRAIYDTPCIQAEGEKWQQVKKNRKGNNSEWNTVILLRNVL